MAKNSHDEVLQDLKTFITETKVLLERVMKMRIQCQESQISLLRLFNPKCIKTLEISNELSRQNVKKVNKDMKIKVKLNKINDNTQIEELKKHN